MLAMVFACTIQIKAAADAELPIETPKETCKLALYLGSSSLYTLQNLKSLVNADC